MIVPTVARKRHGVSNTVKDIVTQVVECYKNGNVREYSNFYKSIIAGLEMPNMTYDALCFCRGIVRLTYGMVSESNRT